MKAKEAIGLETGETTVITIAMLQDKAACREGLTWVKRNLPDGAEYGAFIRALETAGHREWADWLIDKFGSSILAANWRIKEIIDATEPSKVDTTSSGDYAKIGSSGDSAQIGSSGDSAQIGSSGHSAQIGSSGDYAKIGSSGHSAQIGSSGHSAKIGSSGDSAQIGSSGHSAQIEAIGEKSIIAAVAPDSVGRVGKDGCLALRWTDSKGRPRLAVGYEGEELKANIWYRVDESGKFVEAKQ